jgi:hypothetical protein
MSIRCAAVILIASLALTSCGGSDDPSASQCADPAGFECAPTCGGDVIGLPVCRSGNWVCGPNEVKTTDCPADTCFQAPVIWCCDSQGNDSAPTCPGQAAPVCPADTYMNMSVGPHCAPAGTFSCGGSLSCALGAEYCKSEQGTWSCVPLPAACGTDPDCSCLLGECSGSCSAKGIGAITQYCDG